MSETQNAPALSGSPRATGSDGNAWQPIETLPRDGTPVLVWAEPMHAPDVAWHEETGSTLRTYTHWTSLPKPPNTTKPTLKS